MVENRPQGPEAQAKQSIFMIDGMPSQKSKHPFWCGWSSASQLVQYHGYSELTQEKLFSNVYATYDWSKESHIPTASPRPTIDTLADVIKTMTDLTPRIASKKDFDKIKEKNPNLATPHDVLQYYIKKQIPCIVRTPGHFLVTKGMDLNAEKYMFNDPSHGNIRTYTFTEFDRDWKHQESWYNRDTSYLMLTTSTHKKTQ